MALQECGNGHIYNTDLYPQCPYCRNTTANLFYGGTRGEGGLDYGATVAPQGYANAPQGGLQYGATVAPQGYAAADSSKTVAPSFEYASTEQPKTVAPSFEYASTEQPKTVAPSFEYASTEQPKTEAPSFEYAPTEQPKTEVPSFEYAPTEQPKTEALPFEYAPTEQPQTEAPEMTFGSPAALDFGGTEQPQEAPPAEKTPPVVGWLVCLGGRARGRDFRVYQKRNTVGRSDHADVRLPDEAATRFAIWARIDYNDSENLCRVIPLAAGNVLINGAVAEEGAPLHDGDRVTMGGCDYRFTALCGSDFRWDS